MMATETATEYRLGRLDAAMAMLRAAGVQDELLTAALDGAARKVDGDGAAT
jgi:hypothetical protein